jgi:hypothetical protein
MRKHLEREEQTHMINNNISTPASHNNVGSPRYDSEVVSTVSPQSGLHTNNIIVECPLLNDVIFRRSKPMIFHSGNVKFQDLIESHIYEHSIDPNTPLLRRKEIEIEILNEVLKPKKNSARGRDNSGGRFLTWNMEKKWWMVMDSENEIQLKIYHAFLSFRKKMLKTQQQQQEVQTVANLNSLFEQQDGQKKKRFNDINGRCCSNCALCCASDDNNNGCSGVLCVRTAVNHNRNNSNDACGFFFSTDDGSYACLDDDGLSHPTVN